MKINRQNNSRLILVSMVLTISGFFSCIKGIDSNNTGDPCAALAKVKVLPVTAITKGEGFTIAAEGTDDAIYDWRGPNNFQSNSKSNSFTDSYYWHEGWYYLTVSANGCNEKTDSVYLEVRFPQGTPPCSPANNTMVNSNGLPDFNFTSGVYLYTNVGEYNIVGNSANGDVSLVFSPYWLDKEPKDGIYYTTDDLTVDYNKIDEVFISQVNSNVYFTAEVDKPVYVSHVNGHLQVSFCGVKFSGSNGQSVFNINSDAKLTRQ